LTATAISSPFTPSSSEAATGSSSGAEPSAVLSVREGCAGQRCARLVAEKAVPSVGSRPAPAQRAPPKETRQSAITPSQGKCLNRIGDVIDVVKGYPKVSFLYKGKVYVAETSRVRGPMAYGASLRITQKDKPDAPQPSSAVSFDATMRGESPDDQPTVYAYGIDPSEVDALLDAATAAIVAAGAKGVPKE
jgi:hypothetical protein